MSDQNNREYELNINGNRFQISSNCGEEHIRKVERFLDEQISEVNRQTNAYGPTNLAFLVALNLADELLNLRGRLSRYEEVEEGLSRLCERLENVLSSPANSDQNGMALPDLFITFYTNNILRIILHQKIVNIICVVRL